MWLIKISVVSWEGVSYIVLSWFNKYVVEHKNNIKPFGAVGILVIKEPGNDIVLTL